MGLIKKDTKFQNMLFYIVAMVIAAYLGLESITRAAMGFTFLSVGLFFLAHVFKKTFKLDYYRPVILPFAIIIFTLAILPPSHISLNYLMISLIDKYLWIVTLGLLAIVISYAYFRRNKRIKSKKSSA